MRMLLLAALVLGSLSTGCALFDAPADTPQSSAARSAASTRVPRLDQAPPPRPLAEGELPLLVLLDLTSDSMARAELDALSQRLWYDLLRTGRFVMLPREVLPRLLADRGIVLAAPYREPLPLTALGRHIPADYIVSGNVGRVGDTTVLDCSLLDVAEDRIVGLGSVTVRGNAEDLVPRLPGIARDLVSNLGPRSSGVRVADRSPERQADAPPPRPPDVRALVRNSAPSDPAVPSAASPSTAENGVAPIEPAEEPSATSESPVTPASPEPAAMAQPEAEGWTDPRPEALVAAEHRTAEPEPREVEPEPMIEEPSEEQRTFLEANGPASGSASPGSSDFPNPSSAVMIASARQDLRDAINNAANPHGTLTIDPEEAANFRQEANSFPPDSPMRARMLERALELNPQDAHTLLLAAQAHFVQQEYEVSRDECLAAISLEPDSANAHTILGAAYHHMGENALAVAAQMRALELQENNHFAQYNLALSLEPLDPARAAQAFERYVEMADGIDGQRDFVQRAQTRIAAIRQSPTP